MSAQHLAIEVSQVKWDRSQKQNVWFLTEGTAFLIFIVSMFILWSQSETTASDGNTSYQFYIYFDYAYSHSRAEEAHGTVPLNLLVMVKF